MSVATIGLDLAKTVSHVHGVNETGKAEVRRTLRRREVVGSFEAQPARTAILEACGAARHRGRVRCSAARNVPRPQPISAGKYFRGGPVLGTNKMPLSTARSEVGGLPSRGLGRAGGSKGAITAQGSSGTSSLARAAYTGMGLPTREVPLGVSRADRA